MTPEYFKLVDAQMHPVTRVDAKTIALVAARVGAAGTRLIDNVVLGEGIANDVPVRGAMKD